MVGRNSVVESTILFFGILVLTFMDLKIFCSEDQELCLFLLKSGLLSDYSGVCKSCKVGNVNFLKDGDCWKDWWFT